MKRIVSILLVVLMAFLVLAPATNAMAATKKESVKIVTRDPYTSKVMGSIKVQIYKITKYKDGGVGYDPVKTIKTNSKGTYTVSLQPGTYEFTVLSAPKGYGTDNTKKVTIKAGSKPTVYVSVCPLINVTLTVTDNKGKAVSNAYVDVSNNIRCVTGTTNSKGVVTLKNVMYGSNRVTVNKTLKVDGKNVDYRAYDKSVSFKGESKKTIKKTIQLPAKSKWVPEASLMFFAVKKPMIYLYSAEEQDVTVKLGNPENLLVSYPEYPEEGWEVTAHADGLLTDKDTGRSLYGLYWEGKNHEMKVQDTGFVVEGKDAAKFLEEKLAYLGLNERETEEFIVYWLPKLQANAYNYIRFATAEEIEECMPLETEPAADKVIRVWMETTALDEKIEIEEQQLEQVVREDLKDTPLLMVEWGCTDF